ncbi:GH36-type glycosyl hydrolase domain-containing protein [Paenibacillus sp. MMO-177]|uniref:GH36-type glycosyl hydrolase domain-containing protein n=1 Tax=Paenibacillus sp. MMO-177 TaxID=3081289 RepID=UPI0030172E8A
MPTTTEQLRERAHELALQQQIKATAGRSGYIKKQFDADIASIRAFVALLQDEPAGCGQQAEEWLLDNAEFIEEQALNMKMHLSESSLIHLPGLRGKERLRIHALCLAYLDQVDGILDEGTLLAFLGAYQEISVLTLAETRLIPIMLKVSLIGKIAETMALVRERREVCSQVLQLLRQIEPAGLSAETIGTTMEQAGQTIPLSGPWVAHLICHLREWSGDSAVVREWLVCTYENGSDDLDRIVTYEAKLQAAYQLRAGNLITSLRSNERKDWVELFEAISLLDRTMREDATGLYPRLDTSSRNEILNRIEDIARRLRVPESLVAQQSLELAKQAYESGHANPSLITENTSPGSEHPNEGLTRQAFAAFYVFEPAGVKRLVQALKHCSKPRNIPFNGVTRNAPRNYVSTMLALFVLFLVAAAAWVIDWHSITNIGVAAVFLALLFPVSEWVMTSLNFGIERICRTKPLLRFDYSSGIEAEAATMVVIPAIWSTVQEVEELADRLEIHFLGNRDPNIHYALLGDFADAREERLPSDELLIAAAKARIDRLNRMYGDNGTTFHYYQRVRQWNPGESRFMGWERKRGKLVEFVELLRGSGNTSYEIAHGDQKVLPDIRYIITLDADTQLPLGSAQRLIGTLHFPYNRPRLNKEGTRVVEGYGVLQPRIGTSHESAMRSRLAHFWSDPGIDPYAFTVSDPYQDVFDTGIFTGKGIFDINVFAQLLGERIPDNTVLSHDLLEGGFLRAGLVSDIELIEEHPSTFLSFQKRMHRWVRGDWQLLCWLRVKLCDRRGELRPIDLSLLTRWQIIDNLRRSLLPIALFVLFALAVTVLPGYPVRWMVFLFLTMLLPLIRQLANMNPEGTQPKHVLSTLVIAGIGFWTLPFQTAVLMDAVFKTLYRMTISKRGMLEWTSFSQTERSQDQTQRSMILGGRGGFLLILLFAALAVVQPSRPLMWFGLALCLFWALAPLAVRWLDQPVFKPELPLEAADSEKLRSLAKEIWQFYEDFAGKEDHFLPPDNVQIEPPNGVAHRTSPTNIGFLLTAALAARELGFITTTMLVERLERTVGVIERMEKWNGHLYNWYDTSTLELLRPAYVSTVDSGNFVASLMTVKQGLIRWLQEDGWGKGSRRRAPAQAAAGGTEFAMELDRIQPEDIYDARQEAQHAKQDEPATAMNAWIGQGYELVDRLERLIVSTDFRQLYDDKAKLFVLGFHADSGQREKILYDLLASEARQTSFVAIALGQISVSHWLALGRTAKKQGGQATLISWSGTMFEYMMPWLIMRTYPGTVWDSTYRGVVQRQIEFAEGRSVPFGISESGYYAFDYQLNYQYRAFGVPGLGFKRGLEEDTVVAPYATIMALPFALRQGLQNLARLDQLGMRGQYGYYEAIDFTARRMPQGESHKIIRSFMAHHQGMSLLTLANMLVPSCMINYFHADKRIQAAELLLIERIPPKSAILSRELPGKSRSGSETKSSQNDPLREFAAVPAPLPEANVHGNGSLTTVLTETGGGFIRYNGLDLTRWREDPVTDPWGSFIYVRDVEKNVSWSPSYLPCRKKTERASVQFRKERTTFLREDDGLSTKLEVTVSAEHNAELRRLTLTNATQEARIIEITTYMELAMAAHNADKAHPSFTKLFVQTEFAAEAQCLLARKRPRNDGESALWAFHTLRVDEDQGEAEFETDRAAFIGRGHTLANPRGLDARLGGTYGAVADPAFIMRRRVHLEPGRQISLIAVTGAAESKEQALEMVRQLSSAHQAERTFQMAWTRSQIDLQHFHMNEQDASAYQLLAGRILIASPLQPEQEVSIAANKKGQPGLWAHGVSGDRPIVLVSIADTSSLPFMNKLLVGYEYLSRKGLSFDLVIWNESPGGYQQELRDALQRIIERYVHNGGAGVHIVAASEQSNEDRHLLFAAARLLLHAEGPSLRAQLLPREPESAELLPKLAPIAQPSSFSDKPARNESAGLFFNGYGEFSPDGSEYRIALRNGQHLPAPWINVIANPNFGFLASELYTGQTWWRNSRECKLTPWSNDPALDPPGEAVYIRDERSGEYWGMTPSRKLESKTVYNVSHGQGYSRYEHESHGLSHEMTVFVPLDDPVKIIRLRLTNDTHDVRKLSVTYYAEWVIGVNREENASNIVTEWDPQHRILLARNSYQDTFRNATPFLAMHPRVSEPTQSWTGSRLSFIGREGDLEDPAAMRKAHLSGETGPVHDACGAVQSVISLEPGEDRVVYILLGCGDSRDSATRLAGKYGEADACEQAYQDARAFWKDVNGTIKVATPSAETDIMLNNWLLYQSLSCRMWARTAFYQAGGAFGFRDQLQDSLSMLHARPDMTRAQIILHASHQYREGDVQHWWHEETHRGIRTRFSDDLLWLPYAVIRYLEHTEDESILAEIAPYLQSEPLNEDEHERYEETVLSQENGSILEHCFRAIDRALRFGEHGLPLMGIGDWNDGMSNIGPKGRGESVWLGWFLGEVLRGVAGICERHGERERAELYRIARSKLETDIQEAAWDGNWYRRAFTDDGEWLGSVRNAECRIDAIAQSWSVISGMAPKESAQQAMRSFDRELVDRHLAVAHILTPPFDKTKPSPGYIQAYPPGIRENGGQYTHGVIWSIVAWSILGDGDKAFELFHMFNPITHTKSSFDARTYVGEPYAMTADVYTEQPHRGHAGWTWYTGAAGWMYQAGIEWILGLKRRGRKLLIQPCIPAEWPEFTVTYTYKRTAYRIIVRNPLHKSGGCTALWIDGKQADLSKNLLDESPFIMLEDDQLEHVVELTL